MGAKKRQTMAHNKLLLLYLLKTGGIRMSEFQLTRIMEELALMRYFDLKESLFELEQNGHIYAKPTPGGVLYEIGDLGGSIVDTLKDELRLSSRKMLDEYVKQNKESLIQESQYVGEYIKLSDNEYRVYLRVLEDSSTAFEVNLLVYSREQANEMVKKWKEKAVMVYKELITMLT